MKTVVETLLKLQKSSEVLGFFVKKSRDLILTGWLRGMQWLCVLFLIVHSLSLGLYFLVFCIAVICSMGYALNSSKLYRNSNQQKQKIARWIAITFITVVVAQLWRLIVSTEDGDLAVYRFTVAASEAGLVIIFVEIVIKMIQKSKEKAARLADKKRLRANSKPSKR